jgi:hypothetical protein
MFGHDRVIAVRQRGMKPPLVLLNDYALPRSLLGKFPEETAFADVLIEPKDALHRLDLRFLVGLVVLVHTEDESRAKALESLAMKAGASRVLTMTFEPGKRAKVLRATDTQGEQNTWPN